MRRVVASVICCVTLLSGGCTRSNDDGKIAATEPAPARPFAAVDGPRLLAADDAANAGQWMSYGRDYAEQRFSPLTSINTETVRNLGLGWFADFDTHRGQESTPLAIDGAIYVTTAWSKVYAFEAATGQPLWKFDPQVPGEWAVNACCDVVNRGVAAWKGKVYLGTLDGRLIAIDARTGKSVWEVQVTDKDKAYSITGAPRIAGGRVFIGEAGSEFSQRGFMSAYDAETGKLDWRWYIVPGNPKDGFENKQMELAARTWGGQWWKTGGGGGPWDGLAYDAVTNYILIGTGNGAPWPAEIRSPGNNDNLYLSSIVALKADTGEYVWHYQMTPHDSWDYDGTQQITIADLTIDGQKRHVAMQASKNGFFYILDAREGTLISAEPFVKGVNWATRIDPKSGRPVINPAARYDVTGRGFIQVPGFSGAHNWHPMSYSPLSGLVYIPAMEFAYPFVATREDDNPMGQKLSISFAGGAALLRDPKALRLNKGFLLAWDPVNHREVWRVPFDDGRSGGAVATAGGLVFAGNSKSQEFAAYRADTGERLWGQSAQTGVLAGPSTFTVNGEQYVAVVAGYRLSGNYWAPNYSRLLVYKLGGSAKLPEPAPVADPVLSPPPAFGTPQLIAHGREVYGRFCGTCHGNEGFSRGMFPDLRYAGAISSADAFRTIVIDGALARNGMVSFAKALQPADPEAIRAYLVSAAIELQKSSPHAAGPLAPAAPRGHAD
jgi:alcohol dehydrogenase (cytochrome c)/quinohemoprotein ethanol dehydrogenase